VSGYGLLQGSRTLDIKYGVLLVEGQQYIIADGISHIIILEHEVDQVGESITNGIRLQEHTVFHMAEAIYIKIEQILAIVVGGDVNLS